jgi:hypothetical protein
MVSRGGEAAGAAAPPPTRPRPGGALLGRPGRPPPPAPATAWPAPAAAPPGLALPAAAEGSTVWYTPGRISTYAGRHAVKVTVGQAGAGARAGTQASRKSRLSGITLAIEAELG